MTIVSLRVSTMENQQPSFIHGPKGLEESYGRIEKVQRLSRKGVPDKRRGSTLPLEREVMI